MHTYTPRTFTLPSLEGISDESVKQHIGLYEGYVKNFNAISAKLGEYAQDSETNAHALSELIRRRSFEFDGMRLHELYFAQFEGGPAELSADSALAQTITAEYQKTEYFLAMFKAIAMMRGPGWAMLYYDKSSNSLLSGFVGEQHQGHFATLPIVLALDVWEHSYILDQGAAGKGKYVDAFFANLNWNVVAERFAQLQ